MTSNHVFYRLRSEVERLEVSSQETLLTQQAKHNLEISGLKEQLDESERRLRASDMDMASLREKLDQARLDSLQVRILKLQKNKRKNGKNLVLLFNCSINLQNGSCGTLKETQYDSSSPVNSIHY